MLGGSVHSAPVNALRYLVLIVAFAPGCVRTLPPVAAPPRELPEMRTDVPEPAPGEGRVALDVVDGPARVDEVVARSSSRASAVAVSSAGTVAVGDAVAEGATTAHVCTTPCLVNLPHGTHELIFTLPSGRADTASVMVGTRPTAYRRVLAIREQPLGRGEALAGFSMMMGGLAFAGIGFGIGPLFVSGNSSGLGVGLLVLGGVGVVLAAIGIPLLALHPADQREGAGVEWYLDTPAPTSVDEGPEPTESRNEPARPRRRRAL